jgi:hypothetical protein
MTTRETVKDHTSKGRVATNGAQSSVVRDCSVGTCTVLTCFPMHNTGLVDYAVSTVQGNKY